jgi:glycosyltransferase involved in cell wall biosynthesis
VKISIVTISFNQAAFLEQAIQSVLTQDYPDVEYIVVDPGSTDGSRRIIERYRDRIDHVIFEPDEGPADGLNRGFSVATGEIYGFLNSDDCLLEGALSSVSKIFQERPNVDVVSGHGYVIDKKGHVIRKVFSDSYSLYRDAYGQSILIQPSSFFSSRSFRKAGGFNIENHSNWDGELFYRIAMNGGCFALVNEFWSGYRLYPDSITGSASMDAKIRAYGSRKFEEIMGRKSRWYDALLRVFSRMLKHLLNPHAAIERLRKGKIYGQG